MGGVKEFGLGFETVDARRQMGCARLAEELGYGTYWVPEDYFFRGAFALASAIACSTRTMRVGLGSSERGGFAPSIDHADLPQLAIDLVGEHVAQRLFRGAAAGERVEHAPAEIRVHPCLGGDRADPRAHERAETADGRNLRRDGDTELSRARAAGDDRERGELHRGRSVRILLTRCQ